MMINKIVLEGRLTHEPLKKSKGDKEISICRLAYDFGYNKDEKKTKSGFIDVVLTSTNAKFANENLHKGNRIICSGLLAVSSYETKEGEQVEKEVILADFVESLEKKEVESKESK